MSPPRLAFAGDRALAVRVLDYLLERGVEPLALLVSDPSRASHAEQLRARLPELSDQRVLIGSHFRQPAGQRLLRDLQLDYVIGVHFPYIVPEPVLELPRHGVLNLHPAYLPWNRGWHTPSWSLLEGTPIGATLHFMDEGIDTGDIVHQRRLEPRPDDTAHSLYQRLMELEYEVFREAWPLLEAGDFERRPQDPDTGTTHRRGDLYDAAVQRIDLDARTTAGSLLRRLRALTTSSVDEAAYFEAGGSRWRVQVRIIEEPAGDG